MYTRAHSSVACFNTFIRLADCVCSR